MTGTIANAASMVIIGRTHGIEFDSLRDFLRRDPAVRIVGEFPGIPDAISAGVAETISPDIAVVLQAYSDEYSQEESHQLIGRLLFGRVFCCYGPWCQADGRSHQIWPVSVRIPIASAQMIISRELKQFLTGSPPLSPMSAAEEVFVHQIASGSPAKHRLRSAALIISDDRPLRATVDGLCSDWGLKTLQIPRGVDTLRAAIRQTSVRPDFAILDLDPLDAGVVDVIGELEHSFPDLKVLGMSVFPRVSIDAGELYAFIEKTELATQLQWHLA